MATDIEEFDKLVKEKGITSVDEMLKESHEYSKSIPNLEENFHKIVRARGTILELSTILDIAFNEILLKVAKKERIDKLGFKTKAKFIKNLLEEVNDGRFDEQILKKFERFVDIRNIFAHVPVNRNKTSLILEFNTQFPYKTFFNLEPEWKEVSIAIKEYMEMADEIIKTIPKYIEIVIAKQNQDELINKVFEEILKEDEDGN